MSKSKKKHGSGFKRKVITGLVAVALLASGAAGGHAVTISKFNPEVAKDNSARIAAYLYVQGCTRAAQVILANNPLEMVEVAGKCADAGAQVYASLKKQITDKVLYTKPGKEKSEDDSQGE